MNTFKVDRMMIYMLRLTQIYSLKFGKQTQTTKNCWLITLPAKYLVYSLLV